VSEEIICDDGSLVICTNDSISINPNGVESLDLNTSCKKFFTHYCVKCPCISPRIWLIKFYDDMLVSSCDHDKNDSISSSCCMAKHVEEIKEKLCHIIKEEINRRTKKVSIKRRQCYEFHEYGHLARACPTLDNEEPASIDEPSSSTQVHMCLMATGSKGTPTLNPDTSPNDESDADDNEAFLHEIGIVYSSLRGNENAHAKVEHLMETLFEPKNTIKELNSLVNEGKRRFNLLKQELSEEKHTNSSLPQSIKSCELTNVKSINDVCATNSTSCEASILKENVEVRAQLELLTSNYKKLEESSEKLSGSHGGLLISYTGLKLAHEASITKKTSYESHLDISTTLNQKCYITMC
jgi:hypothetical protein